MASMAEDFYDFHEIEIRDYQEKGIREIYEAWENPKFRRVMFQMPTGTGKTVVFNQIVKQELEQNSTVLIVAHRGELVRQNLERLREHFGIEAGIIMGNHCTNPSRPVQVATIQTLDNRDYSWLNPSLIIIDEAHHVPAQSYVRLLNKHQKAKILGVTATPIRLNGEGFTGLFDQLITSKSIKEFIKDGHLADIQYIGRNQIWSKLDLGSISTNNTGDYDPNQLSRMMRQDFVMADLVKSYVKYAQGKKMIVFAVDIEHSKDIVKRYEEAGFKAAHLDGKTKKLERKEIINKFKSGEIQILSNFDIVSEGFDVPDCEVVQLARPTKSLVVYLQQIGRCMRPSETKTHCIVLDNVGLRQEFGSPKDDRPWKLEATKNNPKIINPNPRPFEEFTRNNPEEVDEDLVVLEDVDMPTESKTISKSFPEIDDELKLRIEIKTLEGKLKREKDTDVISQLEQEKENRSQELGNVILNQEKRLQEILLDFQELIKEFFNQERISYLLNRYTYLNNECCKKIFMLRLKISYEFSKKRIKVDLDDREKNEMQYLEIIDIGDELTLKAEILQLTLNIKQKIQDIKMLQEININIDDYDTKVSLLISELSELELKKKNKYNKLYKIILDQETLLQGITTEFRKLIYSFFNKSNHWESEDDKKNFVWRLKLFYDFSSDTVKAVLDDRHKKLIAWSEAIINEISCFSEEKGIDNESYSNYYSDNTLDGRIYWENIISFIFDIYYELLNKEISSFDYIPYEIDVSLRKSYGLAIGRIFQSDLSDSGNYIHHWIDES